VTHDENLLAAHKNYPSPGLENFMSLRQQWHNSILYLGYKLWVWTFLAVTTHISIMHLLIIFSLAFDSFNYTIMFTFDVHIPWMNHGAQICQGLTSWHPNDLACLNTQFVFTHDLSVLCFYQMVFRSIIVCNGERLSCLELERCINYNSQWALPSCHQPGLMIW
jgi:hypothetical protein